MRPALLSRDGGVDANMSYDWDFKLIRGSSVSR